MSRPVGSGAAVGLPPCRRPGHKNARVTLNGTYGIGGHRRQRYRCYPHSGAQHSFVGLMAREVVAGGVCQTCENPVARHQGPSVVRRYRYPARVQAAALVAVGKGESYASAARKARLAAGRKSTRDDDGGQLVANWVEVLAPVVLDHYREIESPETLLADSTNFYVPDHRRGGTMRAFSLLATYGYPYGEGRGRAWVVKVSPTATIRDWRQLLEEFEGPGPSSFISDKAGATWNAVRKRWPGDDQPMHHRCEWHLRDNALKLMRPYDLTGYGSVEMKLLNDAFKSPEGWEAFKDAVGTYRFVGEWCEREDDTVQAQVERRSRLPEHYTNSAVEQTLARMRTMLNDRSFCFRNAARTNLLVGLMRLELNGTANETHYADIIRDHLDEGHGQLDTRQLTIADPKGIYSIRP